MIDNDESAINLVLQDYFLGIFNADIERLEAIFDVDCRLYAPGIRLTLPEWLKAVAGRSVPRDLGNPYAFNVLALDIVRDQAMAKVHCPIFEFNYIDFIGLLKQDGQWRIVSKMYVDVGSSSNSN